MDRGMISSRYARALFDYASRHGALDGIYADTQRLTAAYGEYPALGRVLGNLLLSADQKVELVMLASGGKVDAGFGRFIRLVVEMRREEFLPTICLNYRQLVREAQNIAAVRLITAVKIDRATERHFIARLGELTGKKIELHLAVDSSLVGGYVVRWDTWRLDRSVSGRLKRIEKLLTQ